MAYQHYHAYLGFKLVGFGQTEEECLANVRKYLHHIGVAFVADVDQLPIRTTRVNEKPLDYRFGHCDYCDNF